MPSVTKPNTENRTPARGSKRLRFPPSSRAVATALGAWLLAATVPAAEEAGRRGSVQFSNGEVMEGTLALAPGASLKVNVNEELKTVDFATVREIRMAARKEEMERHWRFAEAGRTEKQFFGEPYPVRYLEATVFLSGGATLRGHLYTTPLYVEGKDNTEKVVLAAKQQGKEGDTFDRLVYPVRVTFGTEGEAMAGGIRLAVAGAEGPGEVAALTRGGLMRLEARPTGKDGEFLMPSTLGDEVFLGLKDAAGIAVGWPGGGEAAALVRMSGALQDVKDFFDGRKLLGVWRDAASRQFYTLLMLTRQGATSLEAASSRPWRLEVWRWKESEDQRLMLAGRAFLFRGILPPNAPPPPVRLSKELWETKLADGAVLSVAR